MVDPGLEALLLTLHRTKEASQVYSLEQLRVWSRFCMLRVSCAWYPIDSVVKYGSVSYKDTNMI